MLTFSKCIYSVQRIRLWTIAYPQVRVPRGQAAEEAGRHAGLGGDIGAARLLRPLHQAGARTAGWPCPRPLHISAGHQRSWEICMYSPFKGTVA